jgi:hypothetical protein
LIRLQNNERSSRCQRTTLFSTYKILPQSKKVDACEILYLLPFVYSADFHVVAKVSTAKTTLPLFIPAEKPS